MTSPPRETLARGACLAVFAAVAFGCSSGAPATTTGGAGTGADASPQGAAGSDPGPPAESDLNPEPACTFPLAESFCAPTFAEQEKAERNLCFGDVCCAWAGTCGEHKVWRSGPDLGGLECVYDETGTTLVAARECSDVGFFDCANHDKGGWCRDAGIPRKQLALCQIDQLPRRCVFDSAYRKEMSCAGTLEGTRARCSPTFAEQKARPFSCAPVSRIVLGDCAEGHFWASVHDEAVQCVYGVDGNLVAADFCDQMPAACGKRCVHAGASPPVLGCALTDVLVQGPGCPTGASGP